MLNFLFTNTPLIFLTQSFWRDEAFSYLMANQSIWQIFLSTAKDFSPPFYYLLLHGWMQIFGGSEVALRSLSLVFFYATIYVIDHMLIDVLKIRTKWRFAYLLLVAINPFLIYYGYEARMYSMSAFFVTLSWYSLLTGKKKLHIISSALGLYTHYFIALALFSQFVYLRLRKSPSTFIKQFVWIGILFAPWSMFTLLFHGSSDSSFWILRPEFSVILLTPGIILTGFENSFQKYAFPLMSLTILAYGATLVTLKNLSKKNGTQDVASYLLHWTFFPAMLSLIITIVKPVFLPRYFIFSATGMSLLIIYSLEQLKPFYRTIAYILVVVFLLQYNAVQIAERTKGDVRSVVHTLRTKMSPNDVIYVESDLDYHTVQYYFEPSRVFIYRKSFDEIPQYIGKVLIQDSHVVSILPQFPKKAYVLHSNLSYDIRSMN